MATDMYLLYNTMQDVILMPTVY